MRYNRRWSVQSYRQKQVFDATRKRNQVMRCPKCGNEVSQDEAFWGQCGTPTKPLPQRTEMVQAPHSGPLQTYNQNNSLAPEVPPDAYNSKLPPYQGGSMAPP